MQSPQLVHWIASCDLILPPTFADYFNCSSLHGLLTSVLPDVIKYYQKRKKNQGGEMLAAKENCALLEDPSEREKFKFKAPPKLLCSIVTNYKTKTPPRKKDAPASAPEPKPQVTIASCKWVVTMRDIYKSPEIQDEVKNMFLPSGKGNGPAREQMVICLTGNFNQLQQLSHETGIPIPMMNADKLKEMRNSDKNALAHIGNIREAGRNADLVREAFESLARYIEAVDLEDLQA